MYRGPRITSDLKKPSRISKTELNSNSNRDGSSGSKSQRFVANSNDRERSSEIGDFTKQDYKPESLSQSSSVVKEKANIFQSATSSSRSVGSNHSTASDTVDSDLPSRREAREAFLRGETAVRKYEPYLKESSSLVDKENHYAEVEPASGGAATGSSAAISHSKAKQAGMSSRESDSYIGFANLPNQVYRKSVKRGFEFTLMVVGESGLGKSTLINSMFLTDLYNADYPGPSSRIKKTVQVDKAQVLLREGSVQLLLTVVDTPGFGDLVDNSNCWQPVIDYIEKQYDEYLNGESRVNRRQMPDNRVHCCLYFISPSGHGLKSLDIEFMKHLHDKVNIVPIIAKADTMTPDECRDFKKTILNEIAQHKIKIYEFPECEDEEDSKIVKKLKGHVPFAVIGSNTVVDCQGKKVRGRSYPWGIVEVENLEHNDFLALRNMLIRTHMQDLKEVTSNVHYENFRYNRLLSSVSSDVTKAKNAVNKSPLSQMEDEKKEHIQKLKKMEADMEQVFEIKVKEKLNKLKESEVELQHRAEQMKKNLEQQEKELQDKRLTFETERDAFEGQQKLFEVDLTSTLKKKKMLF